MLFAPPFLLACCGSFLYAGDWRIPDEAAGVVSTKAAPKTTPVPTTAPLSTSSFPDGPEDTVIEIGEESIRISNYDRLYTRRDDAVARPAGGRDDPGARTTSRPDAGDRRRDSPSSASPDDPKDALAAPGEEAAPAPSAASRGGWAGPDVLIRVPSRGVNGFARSRNLVQIHVFEGGLPSGFDRTSEPDAGRPDARGARAEAQEGVEDEPATDASPTLEGEEEEEALP